MVGVSGENCGKCDWGICDMGKGNYCIKVIIILLFIVKCGLFFTEKKLFNKPIIFI